MENLPKELIELIFYNFHKLLDILHLGQTCKKFYKICKSPTILLKLSKHKDLSVLNITRPFITNNGKLDKIHIPLFFCISCNYFSTDPPQYFVDLHFLNCTDCNVSYCKTHLLSRSILCNDDLVYYCDLYKKCLKCAKIDNTIIINPKETCYIIKELYTTLNIKQKQRFEAW